MALRLYRGIVSASFLLLGLCGNFMTPTWTIFLTFKLTTSETTLMIVTVPQMDIFPFKFLDHQSLCEFFNFHFKYAIHERGLQTPTTGFWLLKWASAISIIDFSDRGVGKSVQLVEFFQMLSGILPILLLCYQTITKNIAYLKALCGSLWEECSLVFSETLA